MIKKNLILIFSVVMCINMSILPSAKEADPKKEHGSIKFWIKHNRDANDGRLSPRTSGAVQDAWRLLMANREMEKEPEKSATAMIIRASAQEIHNIAKKNPTKQNKDEVFFAGATCMAAYNANDIAQPEEEETRKKAKAESPAAQARSTASAITSAGAGGTASTTETTTSNPSSTTAAPAREINRYWGDISTDDPLFYRHYHS